MIKVAIFPSHGTNNYVPSELYVKEAKGMEFRIKLAEKIEEVPYSDNANYEDLKDSKGYIRTKVGDRDILYCFNEKTELIHLIEVVEVDDTCPWRLNNRDGSEYVEYFKGIKVLDKRYNICTW